MSSLRKSFHTHTERERVLLPDRVAIGRIFVEVLQQLQQSQLDALFSGDVGVTDQLMESFSDVTRRVLEINIDFITAYRETLVFKHVDIILYILTN